MINKKIVCDTSIIIDGKITQLIEKKKLENTDIIIPMAVLDELQSQASKGREPGFVGLEELKKIRELSKRRKIKIKFIGKRPTMDDIKLARSGRMDALIRDTAKNSNSILYTADYVQALVGDVEGIEVNYIPNPAKTENLDFEKFFDEETLSIHLKVNVQPLAKKGKPGKFKLEKLSKNIITEEQIENIIREITEAVRRNKEGNLEIVRNGVMIIQLGKYRIAIARPPFADNLEVTVVRPTVKLKLSDYKLSKKLMERLGKSAEGILIAGAPGSGKSTLASSLAEFYMKSGKIVKTLESPKDLQVPPEVTQYGTIDGDFSKTADILLLVRPDYSIYDEIRKTKDFEIFSDLRLAGIGMIGVVHSSKAIDSIQRFLRRVELGLIPHIVDTVIFVKDGKIDTVLKLSLTVKVPHKMIESDLARPLIEVKDFETEKILYEIYTYGEENIILPIEYEENELKGIQKLAIKKILEEIKYYDSEAEVEIISDNKIKIKVDNEKIGKIIGKEGIIINSIEKKLGLKINIEAKISSIGKNIQYEMKEIGNSIEFIFNKKFIGGKIGIYINDIFLLSGIIGKKNNIKIIKNSELGVKLLNALITKKKINIIITN